MTPILFLGAGKMGSAIAFGLVKMGATRASDILLIDPHPEPDATALARQGAELNPRKDRLVTAKTVVLAVKPQIWREAAESIAPYLAPNALIVSIAAGVRTADLEAVFGPRPVARVMPTTAVAVAKGVASVYAREKAARAAAHAVFRPLAKVVDLASEDLMDAATAVSGSGPAYLYALVEAMTAAGVTAGLSEAVSSELSRATVIGAAHLMDVTGEAAMDLRLQVTSPGGTTSAALSVLLGDPGLNELMVRAVAAAVARAKDLG